MVASMTRSMSATTGSFSQVKAEVAPSPWAMCTDLITASGLRSFTTAPSTRRDMNGSSMAMTPARASSVIARPVVSSIATVPGSPRSIRLSIFAASNRACTTPAGS